MGVANLSLPCASYRQSNTFLKCKILGMFFQKDFPAKFRIKFGGKILKQTL